MYTCICVARHTDYSSQPCLCKLSRLGSSWLNVHLALPLMDILPVAPHTWREVPALCCMPRPQPRPSMDDVLQQIMAVTDQAWRGAGQKACSGATQRSLLSSLCSCEIQKRQSEQVKVRERISPNRPQPGCMLPLHPCNGSGGSLYPQAQALSVHLLLCHIHEGSWPSAICFFL